MKKISIVAILFASSLTFLAACTESEDIPYGKWQCSDPAIALDIGASHDGLFFGEYKTDGKTVPVMLRFESDERTFLQVFSIFRVPVAVAHKLMPDTPSLRIYGYEADGFVNERYIKGLPDETKQYFSGKFDIKNGRLHYRITDSSSDAYEGAVVVFEKTEEREAGPDTQTGLLRHAIVRARPYGKWLSSDGALSVDVVPVIRKSGERFTLGGYDGEYASSDGRVLAVRVFFDTVDLGVKVCGRPDKSEVFFEGNYREEDGRLYFASAPYGPEPQLGLSAEIVFDKIESREPPQNPTEYMHPGERWVSADPAIAFNVDAETDWAYSVDVPPVDTGSGLYHFGTYEKDGEALEIVVRFGEDGRAFEIFDRKDYQFVGSDGRWYVVGMRPLFAGVCEEEDGKLRYVPMPPWRTLAGLDEIVFEREMP